MDPISESEEDRVLHENHNAQVKIILQQFSPDTKVSKIIQNYNVTLGYWLTIDLENGCYVHICPKKKGTVIEQLLICWNKEQSIVGEDAVKSDTYTQAVPPSVQLLNVINLQNFLDEFFTYGQQKEYLQGQPSLWYMSLLQQMQHKGYLFPSNIATLQGEDTGN